MNKVDVIQALFDKYYISKEDCIGFLEQCGSSEEQIDRFKAKNATRDKRERSRGFPVYEKEIRYTGKREEEPKNKRSRKSAVPGPTKQDEMFS